MFPKVNQKGVVTMEKESSVLYEHIPISTGMEIYFCHMFDDHRYVSTHWHDAVEIIFLLDGELTVYQQEQKTYLEKDDIILINSGEFHATRCREGNESLLIQIPDRFMQKYIPEFQDIQFVMYTRPTSVIQQTKLEQIRKILRDMQIVLDVKPDGMMLRFYALLFELLYMLYHNYRLELSSTERKRQKNLERLRPVISYVQEHYQEPISIGEIAGIAAFQPEYFCRFFKQQTGMTFQTYLNEFRLSKIYADIVQTDMPIYQILEKHGFTNYKVFRRMFAEQFHDTPSHIRRDMQ